jgi:hypothetical protein
VSFATKVETVGATESTVTVPLAWAVPGPVLPARSTNPFATSDTPAVAPFAQPVKLTVVTNPVVDTDPIAQLVPVAVNFAATID